jgi:hypothetical protein
VIEQFLSKVTLNVVWNEDLKLVEACDIPNIVRKVHAVFHFLPNLNLVRIVYLVVRGNVDPQIPGQCAETFPN